MIPSGMRRALSLSGCGYLDDVGCALRFGRVCCWLLVALASGVAATASIAAEPQAAAPGGIALTDGSTATGELKESDRVDTLRWQSRSFASPFEFAIGAVNAIHYAPAKEPVKPGGELCFELSTGDVLFGSLLSLNGDTAEIDAPPFGHLRIARDRLERIYRWRDRADLVYAGPNGLADWAATSRAGWRDEAGQVLTDQAGAALMGDFNIPMRAEIELAISWKSKPDFALAMGVGDGELSLQQAFRLEVWNDDLVLVRENAKEADIASIQKLADGAGRLHLRVFFDQELGRCLVYSREGERMADLTVRPRWHVASTGIRLQNKQGNLRVERLRVGRWNGEPPQNVTPGKSRVHRIDGTVAYGEIVGFDPERKEFALRDGERESKIAADDVATLFLKASAAKSTPEAELAHVRVVHQDGSQVSGELVKIAAGVVQVTAPGITEPLALPIKDLRALIVLRHTNAATAAAANPSPLGVLELEGLRLPGKLVAGEEQGAASCLVWHPTNSATASALLKGASGRIVYREPPIVKPAAKPQARQAGKQVFVAAGAVVVNAAPAAAPPQKGLVANIVGAIGGAPRVAAPGAVQPGAPVAKGNASMHLRTGDVVPCEVTQIDELGVYFKTPLSDASFAANDKIKALEMIPNVAGPVRLNKGKRDRLLTLPRMQRENPPTHLIRSTNGDYLRGRLTSMDDKSLQLELHLETKKVPRDRVAQIIWLHPDDLAPKPAADAAAPEQATRVQALRSDGVRMTFFADRFADDVLSGKSEVLGAAHVALKEIDVLAIGPAIELHAARLAFQQFKLHNAIEPKIVANDGADPAGGSPSAADSALVNKPAPDFGLELLAGGKFQLAEAKGKIVVLDFFASWCGPCLQTMPQIDKVAKEFADQGVHVIAVNLEEPPATVTSMFERHKLSMPVALDRDGAVSAKYGVTSIPQTIVIDREGKVVRHYIGGSAKLGEEVTAVLQGLLKPATPAAAAP